VKGVRGKSGGPKLISDMASPTDRPGPAAIAHPHEHDHVRCIHRSAVGGAARWQVEVRRGGRTKLQSCFKVLKVNTGAVAGKSPGASDVASHRRRARRFAQPTRARRELSGMVRLVTRFECSGER
jgi:hypothetical protein